MENSPDHVGYLATDAPKHGQRPGPVVDRDHRRDAAEAENVAVLVGLADVAARAVITPLTSPTTQTPDVP